MPTLRPVGKCIYCGDTEGKLSDEHIVPFALNGNLILPKASCKECANVTKKIEQVVARDMYGPLRVKKGFQTRRKKERPKQFHVTVYNLEGEGEQVALSVEDYPTLYPAVSLPIPGILTGAPLSEGNPEMKFHVKADEAELVKTISAFKGKNVQVKSMLAWGEFCRLLAKIAHCYLIAIFGEQGYTPFLPDIILGRSSYLSHYVGGVPIELGLDTPASDLAISLVKDGGTRYIVVFIQLLGRGRLPLYQVVSGLVTDVDVINSRFEQL